MSVTVREQGGLSPVEGWVAKAADWFGLTTTGPAGTGALVPGIYGPSADEGPVFS